METRQMNDICREMNDVRRNVGEGIDEMVESAQTLTDWRHYVQTHPWLCLAGAAAVGFLVVPKRMVVVNPSADVLEELARRSNEAAKANAKSGFFGPIFGLVASVALREAVNLVGQNAANFFAKGENNEESNLGRTAGRGVG